MKRSRLIAIFIFMLSFTFICDMPVHARRTNRFRQRILRRIDEWLAELTQILDSIEPKLKALEDAKNNKEEKDLRKNIEDLIFDYKKLRQGPRSDDPEAYKYKRKALANLDIKFENFTQKLRQTRPRYERLDKRIDKSIEKGNQKRAERLQAKLEKREEKMKKEEEYKYIRKRKGGQRAAEEARFEDNQAERAAKLRQEADAIRDKNPLRAKKLEEKAAKLERMRIDWEDIGDFPIRYRYDPQKRAERRQIKAMKEDWKELDKEERKDARKKFRQEKKDERQAERAETKELRQETKVAKKEFREEKKDARQAERETRQAQRQAERARKEAQRQAEKAQKESEKEEKKRQQELEKERKQAEKEAKEAERQARKEAERLQKEREKAQKEAQKAEQERQEAIAFSNNKAKVLTDIRNLKPEIATLERNKKSYSKQQKKDVIKVINDKINAIEKFARQTKVNKDPAVKDALNELNKLFRQAKQ